MHKGDMMLIDMVIPKGNELDFIAMASRLSYGGLCFLYPRDDFINSANITSQKPCQMEAKARGIELFYGAILKTSPTIPASVHKKHGESLVVARAADSIRGLFESRGIDMVFGLETVAKIDSSHNRNSGLNQVICNLAKTNGISVVFSFASLLNSSDMLRAQIKGRMSQNIRLCRKYKVDTTIASFASHPYEMRSAHDLASLFAVMGMTARQVHDSLHSLDKRIAKNRMMSSQGHIAHGIEKLASGKI